jgi:hypothetical protein
MQGSDYRKIYKDYYGCIPTDETGRTFDIHHIDGNRNNNNINNLKAVNIQEHYDIHYSQGDWGACLRIAEKMKLSHIELSNLSKKAQQKRIEDGTHNFLDGRVAKESALRRLKDGTHNFLGENNPSVKKVKEGTHHWLGGKLQSEQSKKMVENGTHPFLGGEVQRKSGKIGGKIGGAYAKKNRTGIFALTPEQHKAKAFSANITKAIKNGKASVWPRMETI